jgi:hypothetical protein
MTLHLVIGLLHLLVPICTLIYTFTAPLKYDKYAFVYMVLLALHWVLLNGECVISYTYKVFKTPTYQLGDSHHLEDMHDFMEFVNEKTHVPMPFLRFMVNALNFAALIIILCRMLIYASVQPNVIVIAYMIQIAIYFAIIRMQPSPTSNNIKRTYSVLYALSLLTMLIFLKLE